MNTYERAIQIWQVLIAAAHNRQLLTYEILSKKIGVPARGLAGHLEHLLNYCQQNNLPPLTVLAVSTKTGQPSDGYTDRIPAASETLHHDREWVFNHNWYQMRPVTVQELRDLHE